MALDASGQKVSQYLRLAFLASPNFVTGVSGWSINQNGSAEFNNIVIRNGTVISGTQLFYSGTPAAGNLIASIAATASTDAFGNAYLAGVAAYRTTAPFFAAQLIAGSIAFYSAAALSGPWVNAAQIGTDASNDILLTPTGTGNVQAAAAFVAFGLITAQGGVTVTGGTTTDTLKVSTASAAGAIADIINTTAAPTAPNLRVTLAAAGDPAFGYRVSGDSFSRFLADVTAGGLTRLRAGSGAASLDTALIRGAAAQWFADPVAFNNNGAAEVWQTVGGTGAAFAGTWGNAGAPGANLKYRRNAAPYLSVHWVGRVTNTVNQLAGSAITAAVAAAYRPSNTHDIVCFNITQATVCRVSAGSTGILTMQTACNANDVIAIPDAIIGLDA